MMIFVCAINSGNRKISTFDFAVCPRDMDEILSPLNQNSRPEVPKLSDDYDTPKTSERG
jgi:hypothetical protein